MNVLAIDVGSSSVKAGLLRNGKLVGRAAREAFATRYEADRAEANPDEIVRAVAAAIGKLPRGAVKADCIALSTMSPSWLAMDARGKALTNVITHQDRRSAQIAIEIEQRVGKQRHLKLCGNRPIPSGISSTTCAWFLKHEPSLMRRCDLIGHLPTYLHRRLCGSRVVDPSHASFMGVYSTLTMDGWNDELCRATGIGRSLLPEVREANEIGGRLLPGGARTLGLPSGMPMLVGMIDTGAAMLLAGAAPGQMVNVVGTTDVLALCTKHPKPHERLLTRALGVGRIWTSVGTIGSAGSSLEWARQTLFSDLSAKRFHALVDGMHVPRASGNPVRFDPYLAGDRCSVEQRRGALHELTLSTTRDDILASIIDALAHASAERIQLLRGNGTPMRRRVMISGGGGGALATIMHRDWPGKWSFYAEDEATMRGLARLAEIGRQPE
jgi:sugar (pentulose or hexulose) kinase